jgi:hypothetical protein
VCSSDLGQRGNSDKMSISRGLWWHLFHQKYGLLLRP